MSSTLASVTDSVRRLTRPQRLQLLYMIGRDLIDDSDASTIELPSGRKNKLILGLLPPERIKPRSRTKSK